jgi:DNA polymerase IV
MSTTIEACVESASAALRSVSLSGTARPAKPRPIGMRGFDAAHIVCVHVDGFFASVEQALHSRLRGKAVVVGREKVVSASYEAKLQGVTSGMTLDEILEHCPKATVVSGRYNTYAKYAERVRQILEFFCPAVDADRQHGFYLDFFGSPWLTADYSGMLRRLQLEILKNTGLSVSVGAARTRVVAAIASRLVRPRGLRVIEPGTEEDFLASLPVDALDGIGGIDAGDLRKRGISTVGELRRVPLAALEAAYGDTLGRQTWENSRGLDCADPRLDAKPGYFSREVAFDCGAIDAEYHNVLLEYLCERIHCALRDDCRQARAIEVRIQYSDRFTASQSLRLASTANGDDEVLTAACGLLRTLLTRPVAVHSLAVCVRGAADSCTFSSLPATAAIA